MVLRKKVRNQLPFGILEVSRVGLLEFGHSSSLPDYFKGLSRTTNGQPKNKPKRARNKK